MTDEMFEELTPMMIDRINSAFTRSSDYKQAIARESELYESLKKELTKEQKKKLEEYFIRTSETGAVCEKIAYRQGMEDLKAILGIESK